MSKEFAIVIPSADVASESYQLLDDLLTSIVNGKTNEIAEVIVCYDGCTEHFVDTFNEKFNFIIPFTNWGNRVNYARNSNVGLRFAHKELKLPVLLSNMDCILPHKDKLQVLTKPPTPGIVSPTSVPALIETNEEPQFIEVQNKFSYHCPYISTEVMDEIGYIDEGLVSHTDDDHIARALLAGFKCYISNIQVVHKGSHIDQAAHGGSMCGSYDGERLGIDQMRYTYQWQIPKDSIKHEDYIPYILKTFKWNKEEMYHG